MFSCYFLRIIRQSIQVLCPVFSRKVFFRGVEGSNKVWSSKTSLSVSRKDFVEHGGRVISAAKQPEILHVPLVATNDLLSESPNSIFGTSFFLRETMNSLPGTNKLAFTESGMTGKRLFPYLKPPSPFSLTLTSLWVKKFRNFISFCSTNVESASLLILKEKRKESYIAL